MWSSTDDNGEPLDTQYSALDLAPETRETMEEHCQRFQADNAEWLAHDYRTEDGAAYGCTIEESAGHDFWLTRNGHGAGFWDGDWFEPAASIFTEAAHKFEEFTLYIGDDGQIYGA